MAAPRKYVVIYTALMRERACGASAKFTGSGGAIIGVYKDEAMYERLVRELAEVSVCVIKPNIVKTNA